MGESYVSPVTRGREPRSRAWAVWRFRIVALLILALLALGVVKIYNIFSGSTRQDPGVEPEGLRPAITAPYRVS